MGDLLKELGRREIEHAHRSLYYCLRFVLAYLGQSFRLLLSRFGLSSLDSRHFDDSSLEQRLRSCSKQALSNCKPFRQSELFGSSLGRGPESDDWVHIPSRLGHLQWRRRSIDPGYLSCSCSWHLYAFSMLRFAYQKSLRGRSNCFPCSTFNHCSLLLHILVFMFLEKTMLVDFGGLLNEESLIVPVTTSSLTDLD
jgi:hypothetical protein